MAEKKPIIINEDKIKFNSDIVRNWYKDKKTIKNFRTCIGFKYLTFMTYKNNGETLKPLRWITLSPKHHYSYGYVMFKLGYVGYKPCSIYRDHDNWKKNKPIFSDDWNIRKKQKKEWIKNWRNHTMNADFVIDIDGESVQSTWPITRKILQLYNKFNVMYSVYPSGEKGWCIIVPGHKAIKKEYFQFENKIFNTHYALALNIADYLGIHNNLDMSSFYDKRFHKMPYSLDGRNMRALVPLSYEEFINFKKVQIDCDNKGEENPYLNSEYWLTIGGLEDRGMCWNNKGNMNNLDNFLDEVL